MFALYVSKLDPGDVVEGGWVTVLVVPGLIMVMVVVEYLVVVVMGFLMDVVMGF